LEELMGRLRKAKVDTIIKLRNEGFTQAEIAEKVGVHLKTVQKYDPLRCPKKAADTGPTAGMPTEVLERYLKAAGDWINALELALLDEFGHSITCPNCGVKLAFGEKEIYVCKKCGREMPFPKDIWDFGEE